MAWQHALNGFHATSLSPAQARRLAADPCVQFVQADLPVKLAGTQTNPPSWGLDRIDQRNLPLDSSYTYPSTMSLGGGADTALDNAVRNSIASGITYAVASGNSNANACNYSPARVAEAISTNASTNTDARASFSDFGTCTDIFAPGQGITSAWHTSDSATNTISGTSMASPHVAGAVALHLAGNPTATPAAVGTALVNAATPDKVTNAGTGSPNKLLFVGTGTPSGPSVNNPGNQSGTLGTAVNLTVTASGGTAPYSFSFAGLPPGLSGSASGQVTGTPTTAGTYTVTVTVTDSAARTGTAYNLHNRTGGSADNINQTYTVNASSETAAGTWKLRVRDQAYIDTGRIDSWTLDA